MLLAVAATEIEMKPLLARCPAGDHLAYCLSGVGPLEAAVRLTRQLAATHQRLHAVINFGIAGAYPGTEADRPALQVLDICLAEREIFGDFGISFSNDVEPFAAAECAGYREHVLDAALLQRARQALEAASLSVRCGTFVTVAGASGTAIRGQHLKQRFRALCENMEGAAVARVCREFSVPLLEMRVISNLIEDRPGAAWEIEAACERAALAAALLIDDLHEVP
ncbi:MAG: futalosine hydrolase [Desulfofustis sp.]|nr:futalosine hydrolase [Desulfofustis sp.]